MEEVGVGEHRSCSDRHWELKYKNGELFALMSW